jgi:salicylate hydroxylase
VCLIGDAAHPTLPFLAQGANMAIEDGCVLARCLGAFGTPEEAFARFEMHRWERTARIVNGSQENAGRFHNPQLADPERAVAYVDREWQPERVRRRYDWLFEYDPLTTPL